MTNNEMKIQQFYTLIDKVNIRKLSNIDVRRLENINNMIKNDLTTTLEHPRCQTETILNKLSLDRMDIVKKEYFEGNLVKSFEAMKEIVAHCNADDCIKVSEALIIHDALDLILNLIDTKVKNNEISLL